MYYNKLKKDEYFKAWNCGSVANSHMHYIHLVLDVNYTPKTAKEKSLFSAMQTFMYAVFEEKLKTDKGKLLVSKDKNG
jgi:hypothetical protein